MGRKRESVLTRFWRVLCYILAYFGIQTTVSLVYSLAVTLTRSVTNGTSGYPDILNEFAVAFDLTVPILISSTLFLLLAFFTQRRQWEESRFWHPGRLHNPKTGWPAAALLGFAANVLTISILSLSTSKDVYISDLYNELSELLYANNSFAARLFVIGAIGPIAEEVLFRGIVFPRLRKYVTLWPAVFIQAILFGVMHMNVIQGIYGSALGVLMALACHWSGSIWSAITVHIAYNSTSLIITQLLGGGNFSRSAYTLLTVASFVISAACVYLLYNNRSGWLQDS